MTLFKPDYVPDISPEEALYAARKFILRCQDWVLSNKIYEMTEGKGQQNSRNSQASQDKWELYIEFLNHTIRELEQGKLDNWFHEDFGKKQESGPQPG
jgi:hypothetical protein